MDAYKMDSYEPFNITKVIVNKDEIWSCYPKNFTPKNEICKNIIIQIKDYDNIVILVNSLDNYKFDNLELKDVYLVYKFFL